MNYTEQEIDMLKYALAHLHDANLCEFGNENILTLETLLDKFGVSYTSQLSLTEGVGGRV